MSAINWLQSTDWRPSGLPQFGGGGYDLDTCRVPWRGRASGKIAFVNALAKFQSLAAYAGEGIESSWGAYPYMFLNSISDDGEPVFPTISLEYIGFKNGLGGAPPAKGEDSFVQLPISVENLTAPGLGAISFQGAYFAPRTKWTWFQGAKPGTNPAHFGVRNNVSLLSTLFNLVNTTTGGPVSPALAARYLAPLRQVVRTQDYTVSDTVPGTIWSCSCTSDKNFSQV